jgi:hypothetical protein
MIKGRAMNYPSLCSSMADWQLPTAWLECWQRRANEVEADRDYMCSIGVTQHALLRIICMSEV